MSANVDVSQRSKEARHRLRPANGQQDSLHITEFDSAQLPWWSLDRWLNWETLTVAGREIKKGFVVSPFVAGLITTGFGVLLAAMITIGFALYSGMKDRIDKQNQALVEQSKEYTKALQEQRDLLIRLDQRMADKADRDQEYRRETKDKFDSIDAWQGVTNKAIESIRASR